MTHSFMSKYQLNAGQIINYYFLTIHHSAFLYVTISAIIGKIKVEDLR